MSHDHCALLLVRTLPQEAPLLLLVRQSARSRRAAYSCSPSVIPFADTVLFRYNKRFRGTTVMFI